MCVRVFVCVWACAIPHTLEIDHESGGSAKLTGWKRVLEARQRSFYAGNPAKRFVGLCYTNALCLLCVFRLRATMAALPFTFLVRSDARSFTPPCFLSRCGWPHSQEQE